MLQMKETTVADVKTTADATKDAGRVRVGAGMLHFADVTPARDVTKDSGRVHIGAGMLRF